MKGNKKFWDFAAPVYTKVTSKNDFTFDSMAEYIKPLLSKSSSVLEVGCGTGQFTFRLASEVDSWLATDFSSGMVEQVKMRYQRLGKGVDSLEFEQSDVTSLSYEDNSFDSVLIANVLHIIPEPARALDEIKRVLKPSGVLIAPTFVFEGNHNKLQLALMWLIGFRMYSKWSELKFSQFVSEVGFRVESSKLFDAKPLHECVLVARK